MCETNVRHVQCIEHLQGHYGTKKKKKAILVVCESGRLQTGPHNRSPLSEGPERNDRGGEVTWQINEIAIQLQDATAWSEPNHLAQSDLRREMSIQSGLEMEGLKAIIWYISLLRQNIWTLSECQRTFIKLDTWKCKTVSYNDTVFIHFIIIRCTAGNFQSFQIDLLESRRPFSREKMNLLRLDTCFG